MPLKNSKTVKIQSLPEHWHPGPHGSTVRAPSPPCAIPSAHIPDPERNPTRWLWGQKQRAGPFKCLQTVEQYHPV